MYKRLHRCIKAALFKCWYNCCKQNNWIEIYALCKTKLEKTRFTGLSFAIAVCLVNHLFFKASRFLCVDSNRSSDDGLHAAHPRLLHVSGYSRADTSRTTHIQLGKWIFKQSPLSCTDLSEIQRYGQLSCRVTISRRSVSRRISAAARHHSSTTFALNNPCHTLIQIRIWTRFYLSLHRSKLVVSFMLDHVQCEVLFSATRQRVALFCILCISKFC